MVEPCNTRTGGVFETNDFSRRNSSLDEQSLERSTKQEVFPEVFPKVEHCGEQEAQSPKKQKTLCEKHFLCMRDIRIHTLRSGAAMN